MYININIVYKYTLVQLLLLLGIYIHNIHIYTYMHIESHVYKEEICEINIALLNVIIYIIFLESFFFMTVLGVCVCVYIIYF